jgi:hypothetical protein
VLAKVKRHSAARSAAHEDEKVEFALQAGAESTPRVPSGHVGLLRGFAAQHSPHREVRLRHTMHPLGYQSFGLVVSHNQ